MTKWARMRRRKERKKAEEALRSSEVEEKEVKLIEPEKISENIQRPQKIKKLEDAGFIKIKKKFEKNYPLTVCYITSKGKRSFDVFFQYLKSYEGKI